MKRGKPLSYRSAKRIAAVPKKAVVRELVFARDGRCVLYGHPDVPPCSGDPLTPHHLLKASQGGEYSLTNLITLCAGGNTWVEDEPDKAHALGLVVRRGDTHEAAAKRRAANNIPTGLFGLGLDWGDG